MVVGSTMDRPKLSRVAMLGMVAHQAGFADPTYTVRQYKEIYYEAIVHFSYPRSAGMLGSKHIYSFASEPWERPEDAEDQAALQALSYLEGSKFVEIRDYSFGVMKKIKEHNYLISSEIKGMSGMIVELLSGYADMAGEVYSAYQRLLLEVQQQPLPAADDYYVQEVNQMIQRISATPSLLKGLHEAMRKRIFSLHRDCKYDVENWASAVIEQPNAGGNFALPVSISNTFMFDELLTMIGSSSPTYFHVECPPWKVISCCQFYPTNSYLPGSDPYVIPGIPCDTTAEADERSSLRALEFMDTELHTQLRDYNYHMKEATVTANRCLLMQAKELMMVVKRVSFFLKEDIQNLSDIKNGMKGGFDDALFIANEINFMFQLRKMASSLIDIYGRLNYALEQGRSTLEQYEPAALQGLKWYM